MVEFSFIVEQVTKNYRPISYAFSPELASPTYYILYLLDIILDNKSILYSICCVTVWAMIQVFLGSKSAEDKASHPVVAHRLVKGLVLIVCACIAGPTSYLWGGPK